MTRALSIVLAPFRIARAVVQLPRLVERVRQLEALAVLIAPDVHVAVIDASTSQVEIRTEGTAS